MLICFFTIIILIILILWIKYFKNVNLEIIEKWLLNNLFLVLLIIFFIILFLYLAPIIIDTKQLKNWKLIDLRFLDLKYTITTLWAIFAFWYWYKKYERDKELEILNIYWKKYDLLIQ